MDKDVRRLRLTLQGDVDPARRDQMKRKPVGRAYAVVSSRCSSDSAWDGPSGETIKTRSLYDPDIKGMVSDAQTSHDSSLRQLRDELGHLKEVRYSMERVREQLYGQVNGLRSDVVDYCTRSEGLPGQRDGARLHPEGNRVGLYRAANVGTQTDRSDEETQKMREATKRLYGKLQEAERRHESERRVLEDEAGRYQMRLGEARESLQRSEERVAQSDERIEELQRLMTGMEKEHQTLAAKMRENERQLEEMRAQNRTGLADRRSMQLEKEVENLREKVCHLNDMLKSQQRKVRQMIEQLQTSRSQVEEKDVLIQQLQERVEHLESENQEMQDRIEYLTCSESKPRRSSPDRRGPGAVDQQITYSTRLLLGTKKPRALIRVLET
ncbi:tuftelin-like isoform X2 [Heterodontus francisci]|uniref:tuftelin-like isoform X2 n=1 Tax=Heterodontus francisci TaxID=7792 RepID=UPI00355BCBC1